jgi:biopolymer transport protein ExbB
MSAAKSQAKNASNIFPLIIIPALFVVSLLIFFFVLGNPANFNQELLKEGKHEPVEHGVGGYLGLIYMGGVIVPFLITGLLVVITFVIERFITLTQASGTGSVDTFVRNIKSLLDSNKINEAISACDKQKGSVANVVRAGLVRYEQMSKDSTMSRDQKVLAIQKEVEEASTLEMPMLERNLNILATLASIATLLGLLGTVLGMIRSFKALATSGSPDPTALATGISEALINTFIGILTSALAIIAYNYFTGRIDSMTYRIDEAGFSLTQTFASRH